MLQPKFTVNGKNACSPCPKYEAGIDIFPTTRSSVFTVHPSGGKVFEEVILLLHVNFYILYCVMSA